MRNLAAAVAVAALVLVAGGAAADTFAVRLVSQTSTTITLGWTPQPGYGYLFSADGQLQSRTNDPNRSTVRFSKQYTSYDIDVIVKGANGHYPAGTPVPAPPTASFTMAPAPAAVGQNVTFDWTGTCAAGGCTVVWEDEGSDGPGGTEFPWGTGDPLVKSFVTVGTKYVHLVVTDSLGRTAESRQNLAVASAPPPTPACADGIDNDGDGKVDLADPGCSSATDGDETDGNQSTFPNATNTGVPSGTTLTAYTGPMTITTPNTVIDSKDITGCVTVQTSGVIIRKSRITGCVIAHFLVSSPPLLVQDVEFVCNTTYNTAIGGSDFTLERANIHGTCDNGVDLQSGVTVKDSYFHDIVGSGSDPHIDGIQAAWGADSLIQHNTILSRDTSSIIMTNYDGHPNVNNTTIDNNLMGAQTAASVAYVIYCPSVPTSNFRVINNHFLSQFPPVGGYSTGCSQNGIIQSGNVIHETGQPITLG